MSFINILEKTMLSEKSLVKPINPDGLERVELRPFTKEIRDGVTEIKKIIEDRDSADKLLAAEKSLPELFDVDDFSLLEAKLDVLMDAGVEEIPFASRSYNVRDVVLIVSAVKAYTRQLEKSPTDDVETAMEVDAFLAQGLGQFSVTRGKISPESRSGFRDCIKRCIENYLSK